MECEFKPPSLAPIALFVFNRPEHTSEVLISLSSNPEFFKSRLYIYCDGPRNSDDLDLVNKTRGLVHALMHPQKKIIESQNNLGLSRSVLTGVKTIFEEFENIIVVEDDVVVSSNFLKFLNEALNYYKDNERIMQVSAYMFPKVDFLDASKVLFLPNITSWGWATWRRAWNKLDEQANGWASLIYDRDLRYRFNIKGSYDYTDMLMKQMTGKIDSWAIRWNWTVFKCGGLVCYPPISFVRNIGFDGSGTHCRVSDVNNLSVNHDPKMPKFSNNFELSRDDFRAIQKGLAVLGGSYWFRLLKTMIASLRRIGIRIQSAGQ
jgi:hypothetical protein